MAPAEVDRGHLGELDDRLGCLRRVAKLAGILAQDARFVAGGTTSARS